MKTFTPEEFVTFGHKLQSKSDSEKMGLKICEFFI